MKIQKVPQPIRLRYFRREERIEHPKMHARVFFVSLFTVIIVVLTVYSAFLLESAIASYFTEVEGEEAAAEAIGLFFALTFGAVCAVGQLCTTIIHLILTLSMKNQDKESHPVFRKVCAGIRIFCFFLIFAGWIALYLLSYLNQ